MYPSLKTQNIVNSLKISWKNGSIVYLSIPVSKLGGSSVKNWIKQISLDFSTQQKQLHKRTIAALRKYLKEENSKPNPDKQYIVDTEEKITALEEYRHSKLS